MNFHPHIQEISIILGECTRYLRTNTRPETYAATVKAFQKRLQNRQYPRKLIDKLTSRIKFSERQSSLDKTTQHRIPTPPSPVFKCLPPPNFDFLKRVILQEYHSISHLVKPPQFLTLTHPSLRKILIRAEVKPTINQSFDMLVKLEQVSQDTQHTTAGKVPILRSTDIKIRPCGNHKCTTCTHLNCNPYFTSSVTKQNYPIRFSATCSSTKIIYLVTCTRCKKQYVGLTTTQLNTRINHHRSNIFRNKTIYFCIHFNLPNHSIQNLSVQIIDRANTLQELQQLDKYTKKPHSVWS